MDFDFSQTYLYKIHRLTASLDTLFDQALRQHANIGLSQFILLLSVLQHQSASQRTIAQFLDLTPGAISRQVELAKKSGWITVTDNPKDRRGTTLKITVIGKTKITQGVAALESHVFKIFKDENTQGSLMYHLDILFTNIEATRKK